MGENARREIPEADSGKEKSAGSSIAVQAGILAIATIVVRIIGLLYRAPLTAIIGDEGNGYYGAAYNIYMIILILSSNSLPAAISRQMSTKIAVGEYRNAQRTFHCALIYSLIVGTAGSLLLYLGAGVLVKHNAVPVLRVFAPTVFLFGILGAVRGYFQANQSMVQTSVSQILEQIANAAVSIGAASILIRTASIHANPTEKAVRGAMGSAMGTGIGVSVQDACPLVDHAILNHLVKCFLCIVVDRSMERVGQVLGDIADDDLAITVHIGSRLNHLHIALNLCLSGKRRERHAGNH